MSHRNSAPKLSRRAFLLQLPPVGAALLAACQSGAAGPGAGARSAPAATVAPTLADWDRVVAAAKQEGVLSLYGGVSGTVQQHLVETFEQRFPGIKIQGTFAPVNQLIPRLMAERTAGKYLADVFASLAGGPAFVTLKDAGVLAPLQPALVLPEVLDTAAWYENRLWWTDESEPLTTIRFQGSVQAPFSYNTREIDPAQFNSYWDFLDARWKGKLVATDVRNPGPGSLQSVFIYTNQQLGPRYLERLFGEMDITVSNDQRQMIDWLAQGRFPIGVLLNSRDVGIAMEQGLPVGIFPVERLREGGPMGPGAGVVSLADRAPHPNAAIVFVNWLLSQEGQSVWQKSLKVNSLRMDVPKDDIFPFDAPKPGVAYTDMGRETYGRISQEEINGLIKRTLDQAGR
jgi:iron(III) transport system substrate-binding protein